MNYKELSKRVEKIEKRCCCGSDDCCYEEITLAQAQLLIDNNSVVPNTLYKITGVHKNKVGPDIIVNTLYDDGTDSGTTIYLTGMSPTEFSSEGWGEFYNPKYDHNNYGELELLGASAFLDAVGTGYIDDTGIGVLGGSGVGMLVDITTVAGNVMTVTITDIGSGYVPGDSITVDSGDGNATFIYINGYYAYNIFNTDGAYKVPGYQLGRKIIWGGYVWENITGNTGAALDEFTLDDNWAKVAYNETDYNKVIDYIEYDFVNDWICRRRQAEPVIDVIFPFQFWNDPSKAPTQVTFHAISAMQWGNKYNKDTNLGVGLINIIDSYYDTINFRGIHTLGVYLNNYSWVVGNYSGLNTYLQGIVIDNYSYFENLYLNTGSYIKKLRLNNESYLREWTMSDVSYLENISLENGSYLYAVEGSVMIQASSIKDLAMANGCYIAGQSLENSSIYGLCLKNTAYLGSAYMTNSTVGNCVFESAVQGFNYTDQNLFNSSFKNNNFFGHGLISNASPGVTYDLKVDGTHGIINLNITFTGAAGRGAVGPLTLPGIGIQAGWYIEKVVARTNTLTAGAGSYINLGIDTDDPTSGLDNVDGLVTALNASPAVIYTNLGFEPSTDNRNIVMSVGANAITSGTLYLTIEFRQSIQ